MTSVMSSSPVQPDTSSDYEPSRLHSTVRRLLILVGCLASFGILVIILASGAGATTASGSPNAPSGSAIENSGSPAGQPALGQLLPSVQSQVTRVTGTLGEAVQPVAEPLSQVSPAAGSTTAPIVHSVSPLTDSVVEPVVRSVSQALATTVAPAAHVLTPVTAPLVNAVSPALRPVTTALGAQPVVSTLAGSTHPVPADSVTSGDALQDVVVAASTPTPTAVPVQFAAGRVTLPLAVTGDDVLRPAGDAHPPVGPERVPGLPGQSTGLAAVGAGSSVSGSGAGFASGFAVTEGYPAQSRSTLRWPVWSSRRFAGGTCCVHGRDHPR